MYENVFTLWVPTIIYAQILNILNYVKVYNNFTTIIELTEVLGLRCHSWSKLSCSLLIKVGDFPASYNPGRVSSYLDRFGHIRNRVG